MTHKPRLSIPKRTKALRDDEPVILGTDGTVDGTLWTTRGEKEMGPEDDEVLLENLAEARVRAAVEKIVQAVHEQGARFFEVTVTSLLPVNLTLSDRSKLDWASQQGFEFHQDGLQTIIKRQGKVIADTVAEVPVQWRDLVERRIREIQKEQGNG